MKKGDNKFLVFPPVMPTLLFVNVLGSLMNIIPIYNVSVQEARNQLIKRGETEKPYE
jgi:hypothetical protein